MGDYRAYLTTAADIPNTMHELARLREETFRAVGEGKGQNVRIILHAHIGRAVDLQRSDRVHDLADPYGVCDLAVFAVDPHAVIAEVVRHVCPSPDNICGACLRSILSRYNITRPVDNAAELVDICIAHIKKLLRGLLTAVSAPAVDQNDLVKVRQFLRPLRSDALVRNQDRAGDVPGIIFILAAHVHDHMSVILFHHLFRLFL